MCHHVDQHKPAFLGATAMTTNQPYAYLPNGTHVLNNNDGEPGWIMNGFSYDPELGWYEYEVETQYGVERWLRNDMELMSELEQAAADADATSSDDN